MNDQLRRDRHALYERSVLDCVAQLETVDQLFRRRRARMPLTLGEDFCGTAAFSAAWVSSDPQRRAVAIDIDRATLAWAEQHHRAPLGDAATRLQLVCGDVREPRQNERLDLVVANNLSYCVFHDRATLRDYLRGACDALDAEGALVLDVHTGPDAQYVRQFHVEHPRFTYVWDQRSFDPLTHRRRCEIHFLFDDGDEMRAAFRYDWRLWSVPELSDLLLEVGFHDVEPHLVESTSAPARTGGIDAQETARSHGTAERPDSRAAAPRHPARGGDAPALESLYLYLVAWRSS
ncbi:MAG: class I SAM-dependent methyltransferase [Myxococcales bacterium]|nr:class I SAM-dependent methyltransferase [Myxococcales bacterium]